jgi:hypothetical protein
MDVRQVLRSSYSIVLNGLVRRGYLEAKLPEGIGLVHYGLIRPSQVDWCDFQVDRVFVKNVHICIFFGFVPILLQQGII